MPIANPIQTPANSNMSRWGSAIRKNAALAECRISMTQCPLRLWYLVPPDSRQARASLCGGGNETWAAACYDRNDVLSTLHAAAMQHASGKSADVRSRYHGRMVPQQS